MKKTIPIPKYTKRELEHDAVFPFGSTNRRCLQCGRCNDAVQRTPFFRMKFTETGVVMCVCSAPEERDDMTGWEGSGPAGITLKRHIMVPLGLQEEDLCITYAVRGYAKDKPKVSQVDLCRPFLQHDISVVRPRAIVCFGVEAARAVLGLKDIHIKDCFLKPYWYYTEDYTPEQYSPSAIPVLVTYDVNLCLVAGEKNVGWAVHEVIQQHVRKFLFPKTGLKDIPEVRRYA